MEKVMRYQIADYLNIGTSEEEEYALMGTGFNTLDEEAGAQTESVTYINDKAATTYIRAYETVFPFETDLIADEDAVTYIYDVGRNQKTGGDAETDYVRVELFSPVSAPEKPNTFKARKFRVSIEVSSTEGEGGNIVKVSGNLNAVGDFVDGTFDTSTKTFTPASA